MKSGATHDVQTSASPARIGQGGNALLTGAALATNLAALVVVPLAVRTDPRWGLVLVPIALATNTLWSLIHEAIHGLLFTRRRTNDMLGRLLGIAFGAPLRVLRTGHLLHHRFSRTLCERTEVFDARRTSRPAAAAGYYFRLLGGMYLLEALGALGAFLPARVLAALEPRLERDHSLAQAVLRTLRQPPALAEVRFDALALIALFGTAVALYGSHWWMLNAFLAARAFLVSFADNSYHYATRLDAPREAKNLRAPRWLELALLNFTLHGVHHLHPALPWFALRARFERDGARYDDGYFGGLARQLRGPIELSRFESRA